MPTEATGREHLTPVKIRDTSATERGAFRRCRRRWLLSVVHRLESAEGDQNLWLGTFVHAGLEAYYRGLMEGGWRAGARHDSVRADAERAALDELDAQYPAMVAPLREFLGFLWPNLEATYRELAELGFEMVQYYLERERTDPLFDEVVDVERRVMVPIRKPDTGRRVGTLSVKADVVGRRAGVLAVGDHKTASREPSANYLELDDQLTAEVYAVWEDRKRVEFPEEAVYNVLMKKVPRPPKELKPKRDGTPVLSRDKSQPTTYDLYREEIRRLGLDTADYADVLDHFREKDLSGESDFFRRERVLRSEAQVANFELNLYHEWQDMRSVAAHPERAYPNPTPFACPACPVRLICMTMSDDGDVEAIVKANYVVGDPRR